MRTPFHPRKACLGLGLSALTCLLACGGSNTDSIVTVPPAASVVSTTGTWSFGVMGDTQWPTDDGKNPNTVAVGIVDQVNREFIAKGVKFVVQVGDLTDNGSVLAMDTRATYAQPLYNAGIGFFPLRGNHEGEDGGGPGTAGSYVIDSAAAREFQRIYPQTLDGGNNATPTNAFITTTDSIQPTAKTGSTFTVGSNFSTPGHVAGIGDLTGLSYAFDYNNARFVLLDQFTPADATADGLGAIPPQQSWISNSLTGRATGTHAFVFSHKGLITENHVDTLFGNNAFLDPTSNPAQNPAATDIFIDELASNGVRYFMGGHDHIHNRALVSNTTGTTKVTSLIAASASYKFYSPALTSNDVTYDVPAFGFSRETQLNQDLYRVGYYVFTVNGAATTVDFYASDPQGTPSAPGKSVVISATPTLTFTKRDTFGYALNGKEFVVAQGAPYSIVFDSYGSTTAMLLGGTNGCTRQDGSGRALSKAINTGWAARTSGLYSDILTIWGMTELGASSTDTYTLSMNYDPTQISDALAQTGQVGIGIKGASAWVNAITGNTGGSKTFVVGPYKSTYTLGTYGVDLSNHTFWAVLNFTSDFAVAPSI